MSRAPSSDAPRLLVLAGHDPTGGAGIDADREAASAFGVRALCVITALTRQDGRRVHAVGARAPAEWLEDARAFLDPAPDAVKIGLLPGPDHVRAAVALLGELSSIASVPVVVDPVLRASGGEVFLDADGARLLCERLLPLGVHLTPNLPEAAALTGLPLPAADRDARLAAARALLARGARSILLKGGHGEEDPVVDLLLERDEPPLWLSHPRIPGPGLHGSGCRTASALAAQLARRVPLAVAAAETGRWMAARIAESAGP